MIRPRSKVGSVVRMAAVLAGSSTVALSAQALLIVPTYDNTTLGPNGVTMFNDTAAKNAVQFAINEFQTLYSDAVQVNIAFTWGTTGLGSSSTPLFFPIPTPAYSSVRTALINDNAGLKASADGTTSISSGGSVFSTTDPTSGGVFLYARAQAKALGALASDTSNDGTITFSSAQSYAFSRPFATTTVFDFIGVAEHEISEVMGRIQLNGANLTGSPNYTAYDLFDFSGAGAHTLLTGAGRYFSINNGTTNLRGYNNAASLGGDTGDWDSASAISPYNASTGPGTNHAIQTYDIATLDVIGWDRVAVVPEPGSWAMMLAGIAAIGGLARRRNAV